MNPHELHTTTRAQDKERAGKLEKLQGQLLRANPGISSGETTAVISILEQSIYLSQVLAAEGLEDIIGRKRMLMGGRATFSDCYDPRGLVVHKGALLMPIFKEGGGVFESRFEQQIDHQGRVDNVLHNGFRYQTQGDSLVLPVLENNLMAQAVGTAAAHPDGQPYLHFAAGHTSLSGLDSLRNGFSVCGKYASIEESVQAARELGERVSASSAVINFAELDKTVDAVHNVAQMSRASSGMEFLPRYTRKYMWDYDSFGPILELNVHDPLKSKTVASLVQKHLDLLPDSLIRDIEGIGSARDQYHNVRSLPAYLWKRTHVVNALMNDPELASLRAVMTDIQQKQAPELTPGQAQIDLFHLLDSAAFQIITGSFRDPLPHLAEFGIDFMACSADGSTLAKPHPGYRRFSSTPCHGEIGDHIIQMCGILDVKEAHALDIHQPGIHHRLLARRMFVGRGISKVAFEAGTSDIEQAEYLSSLDRKDVLENPILRGKMDDGLKVYFIVTDRDTGEALMVPSHPHLKRPLISLPK